MRGLALLDTVIAVTLLAGVIFSINLVLYKCVRFAGDFAAESRARLLLEGEMECFRGMPPAEIERLRPGEFVPSLGVPDGLRNYRFERSARFDAESRLQHITLKAHWPKTVRARPPLVVEGEIHVPEAAP